MRFNPQAFAGDCDLRAIEALARQTREDNLHVTDLPYRFSSWALDDPENIRLWKDENGRLLAWAVLQTPFDEIDLACLLESESALLPQILAWADRRSQEHPEMVPLGTPEDKPCWFTHTFSDQTARMSILEAAGYADQGNAGEYAWSKVLMERPADLPVKEYHIPKGFIVRPLAGEGEVEAYVRLHRETFRSESMTVEWRERTLRHPGYIPDLDLVVAAPDGHLAAFCVCWLDCHASEPVGRIEPLGCHPDYRRYALGRLVLAEGLRRLQTHGARKIHVETDSWRRTAYQLYESFGFQVIKNVRVYRKDY